uniref:Uncharacterized protein n=1 Tax=Strigamia maritima TaxID=126957 RepID=T1IKV3_STRMM
MVSKINPLVVADSMIRLTTVTTSRTIPITEKDVIVSQVPIGDFYRTFMEMCKHQKINVPFELKLLPHREQPPNDFFASGKPTARTFSDFSIATQPATSITSITSEEEEDIPVAAKLYIELENAEVGDSITQIIIKDWKIDERMFKVLVRSCSYLPMLSKVRLFNAGISGPSMISLIKWLMSIPNLRVLFLDNNPIRGRENFYLLLNKLVELREVSFRFCSITDKGAALLAKSIGPNLLKLNLTGNEIGDEGAASLAQALRLNGTLLSLSLAGNKVGNKGAEALAN